MPAPLFDLRCELNKARRLHISRDEYWKPGDPLWAPGGLRGPSLTRRLLRRVSEQADSVLNNATLTASLRRALRGRSQRQAESLVESLLSTRFKPGVLVYGTVRRLAESLR